jgi:hypothetical protein
MKTKIFTGAFVVAVLFGTAQNTDNQKKRSKIPASAARIGSVRVYRTKGGEIVNVHAPLNNPFVNSAAERSKRPVKALSNSLTDTLIIGTTYFQLQTNSSVRNALVKNKDGSISAVWTFSNDKGGDQAFLDRGTGYAYNNGSAWTVTNPTARLETQRTGWPSIAVTSSNKEAFVVHKPNNLDFVSRSVKGTGSWTEDSSLLVAPTVNPDKDGYWWPRMVSGGSDGNSLHVLSVTYPSVDGGAAYAQQDPALTYSRSEDGGQTWDILHNVNPLVNYAAGFSNITPDCYAIDANGTTIAYVVGGETSNLVLMKSLDNGTTWTKTTIMSFPVQNYTGQAILTNGVVDTVQTNDGSLAILLDKNNIAHVWFGNMFVSNATANDSSIIDYYPGTSGLMYWNETMGDTAPKLIENWLNYDGTGSLEAPTVASGLPFGSFGCSLTSHPSAGIDSNGVIYLAYDCIMQASNDGFNKAERNVYVASSSNGGISWTQGFLPDSLDGIPEGNEQVYPSVARYVNNCMSLIFQEDIAAGHGIGAKNPDALDNSGVPASIVYTCVDAKTVAPVVSGIKENQTNLLSVTNYPNPFTGKTFVNVTLNKACNVTLEVSDVIGQSVLENQHLSLQAGVNTLTIDASHLKAGIYFYTLITSESSVSRKIIVQ